MIITLETRLADRSDIAEDAKNLRYGQLFFLKSIKTGKLEGPYQISHFTDKEDLAKWLKLNMIWVPKHPIENNVLMVDG